MSNTGRDIIRELIDEDHETKEENRLSRSKVSLHSMSPSGGEKKKRRMSSVISDKGSNHSQELLTGKTGVSPFFGTKHLKKEVKNSLEDSAKARKSFGGENV